MGPLAGKRRKESGNERKAERYNAGKNRKETGGALATHCAEGLCRIYTRVRQEAACPPAPKKQRYFPTGYSKLFFCGLHFVNLPRSPGPEQHSEIFVSTTTTPQTNPPRVLVHCTGSELEVTVKGSWALEGTVPAQHMARARRLAADPEVRSLLLRAEDLASWDGSLLALVTDLVRTARKRKLPVRRELPDTLEKLVKLAFAVESKEGSERTRKKEGFLEHVGASVLRLPAGISDFLSFMGDITLALGRFISGRATMRRCDFIEALYECGIRSFGIVAIVNLLFGLILAFVGSVQLMSFGAQVYVAGLVGIGMLRVMGAVMVGIVMSGRIGAAYAALIGSMQTNEEVDAMETMGISPIDFLVLPRMLALTIMVPLLTVFADFMGMLGGFFVGITILDLTPMTYLDSTISMVNFKHGLAGLVYAAVFGIVIAVFGCYHGIRCSRSAQGVGKATTTAVVHSLVGIIVTTAIITIIFNVLNF